MPSLRFNHVFLLLMILAFASAFVVSTRVTDAARGALAGLFAPVARPTRALAAWVYGRAAETAPVDTGGVRGQSRPAASIVEENRELRQALATLTMQLDALKQLDAERQRLGPLRRFCTPVAVIGNDSGGRQALIVQGSSFGALRERLPVLYAGGIVGRIAWAGATGAQVQIVTDPGFRVTGSFGRFVRKAGGGVEFAYTALPPQLVSGIGNGMMAIRDVALKDVRSAEVAEGDWVVLNDGDWPPALKGAHLGRIVSIAPRSDHPLFAEIRLRPMENLLLLREVMVMNK